MRRLRPTGGALAGDGRTRMAETKWRTPSASERVAAGAGAPKRGGAASRQWRNKSPPPPEQEDAGLGGVQARRGLAIRTT
jgi:hypothetical protein